MAKKSIWTIRKKLSENCYSRFRLTSLIFPSLSPNHHYSLTTQKTDLFPSKKLFYAKEVTHHVCPIVREKRKNILDCLGGHFLLFRTRQVQSFNIPLLFLLCMWPGHGSTIPQENKNRLCSKTCALRRLNNNNKEKIAEQHPPLWFRDFEDIYTTVNGPDPCQRAPDPTQKRNLVT